MNNNLTNNSLNNNKDDEDEIIKILESLPQGQKSLMEERFIGLMASSAENAETIFAKKLTEENIKQFLINYNKLDEYRHEEIMKQKQIDANKPWYVVLVIIIIVLFLVFVLVRLQSNESLLRDIFDKIVYLVVGIFGGIGIDRTLFKSR